MHIGRQKKLKKGLGLAAHFILLGILFVGFGADVLAAEYPGKGQIAYVVYWPPGGRSDLVARLYTPYLQKYLGGTIYVNNIGEGSGAIGHKFAKEAKPDGYTIAQTGGTFALQYTRPGISRLDYDWLANIYSTPFVIAVPGDSPFKNLKEVVAFAKANPKKIKVGNTGIGNTSHLANAAFAKRVGVEFTYVPYKGDTPNVIGLASGEVELTFGMISALQQMIEAKKVRILASCSKERLGKIPTVNEEIGTDFEFETWEAVLGPKGLKANKAVYPKLSEAIRKAILDPEFGEKISKMGLDIKYRAGGEWDRWLDQHDKEMETVITELGLRYKK